MATSTHLSRGKKNGGGNQAASELWLGSLSERVGDISRRDIRHGVQESGDDHRNLGGFGEPRLFDPEPLSVDPQPSNARHLERGCRDLGSLVETLIGIRLALGPERFQLGERDRIARVVDGSALGFDPLAGDIGSIALVQRPQPDVLLAVGLVFAECRQSALVVGDGVVPCIALAMRLGGFVLLGKCPLDIPIVVIGEQRRDVAETEDSTVERIAPLVVALFAIGLVHSGLGRRSQTGKLCAEDTGEDEIETVRIDDCFVAHGIHRAAAGFGDDQRVSACTHLTRSMPLLQGAEDRSGARIGGIVGCPLGGEVDRQSDRIEVLDLLEFVDQQQNESPIACAMDDRRMEHGIADNRVGRNQNIATGNNDLRRQFGFVGAKQELVGRARNPLGLLKSSRMR